MFYTVKISKIGHPTPVTLMPNGAISTQLLGVDEENCFTNKEDARTFAIKFISESVVRDLLSFQIEEVTE